MKKKCSVCCKVKSIKEFGVSHRRDKAISSNCLKCYRNRARKSRQASRRRLLGAYSKGKCICACCGESILEFLILDHIGGNKTRVALGHQIRHKDGEKKFRITRELRIAGYPHKDKLRVLCANCNMATTNGRICPHKCKVQHIEET